jgi:hypothetical protein
MAAISAILVSFFAAFNGISLQIYFVLDGLRVFCASWIVL